MIEAARNQHLTGELALASNPPTNVYLVNGEVYFAERTTDGGIGVRLLVEGVITRKQMSKGSVMVSGSEHLGRLFERDESIDRHAVELCVELMTDDVLTSVSNEIVDSYVMTLYKRHSSGIDRWLPNPSPIDAPAVNEDQRTAAFADFEAPTALNGAPFNGEPVWAEEPAPVVAPPAPTPEPTIEPEVQLAPTAAATAVPTLVVPAAPAPVIEVPVVEVPVVEVPVIEVPAVAAPAEVVLEPVLPPPPVPARTPERLQLDEWPTEPEPAPTPTLPKRTVQASDSYPAATTSPAAPAEAPAATGSSTIADEVADAVRRALAAIDSVLTPADDQAPKSPPRPL